MTLLTAALAVGVGITLALTLFLWLGHLEGREPQICWWATAYACFAAYVTAEALITVIPGPDLIAVRHALFLTSSWAMMQSFQQDSRVTMVAIVGMLLSAISRAASQEWRMVPETYG